MSTENKRAEIEDIREVNATFESSCVSLWFKDFIDVAL